MGAVQVLTFEGDQGLVVAGLAQQRQVALGLALGQHKHADVLQQAGQHQFFGLAQAAGLAEPAGRQRAEDAAPPGALAHVLALAGGGQVLGDGEAQGEADGGVEPQHGQCLAEVLDPAAAGIQRRIGNAQHARAQRHVDGDDVGGRGDVGFRVLRQFDDAQGNTGRRGQVAAERQGGCQLGRHGGNTEVMWQEYMECVTDLSIGTCVVGNYAVDRWGPRCLSKQNQRADRVGRGNEVFGTTFASGWGSGTSGVRCCAAAGGAGTMRPPIKKDGPHGREVASGIPCQHARKRRQCGRVRA
ncbi:hypothetical protein D9M71_515300 [compost metagenome]